MDKLILGEALEELKKLPNDWVDSIVTDPPAGISFMGKEWDSDKGGKDMWIRSLSIIFAESLRVLKPGSYALVWALPRTSHWTATALEEAGFEIRDCIYHIFGSGFPKSLDISKAIDKQAGTERIKIGKSPNAQISHGKNPISMQSSPESKNFEITQPATPEAKQWKGWGTALKPAVECWWLIRKPLSEKTVAENVLKWGTGGINIDESRVKGKLDGDPNRFARTDGGWGVAKFHEAPIVRSEGRFPANLIHDGSPEVLMGFPISEGGAFPKRINGNSPIVFRSNEERESRIELNDSGSAARFFYCTKPSKAERDMGLENSDLIRSSDGQKNDGVGGENPRNRTNNPRHNFHPTVKSITLMSYLIKLITPPKGIVLDMFAGSGSTLVAAKTLGFNFIGIEKEKDYVQIAEARLKSVNPMF